LTIGDDIATFERVVFEVTSTAITIKVVVRVPIFERMEICWAHLAKFSCVLALRARIRDFDETLSNRFLDVLCLDVVVATLSKAFVGQILAPLEDINSNYSSILILGYI